MKLTASINVDVNEKEYDSLLLDRITDLLGYPSITGYCKGFYIKENKLIEYYNDGGGDHSWVEEKVIRQEATELDKAVLLVLKEIAKNIRKNNERK